MEDDPAIFRYFKRYREFKHHVGYVLRHVANMLDIQFHKVSHLRNVEDVLSTIDQCTRHKVVASKVGELTFRRIGVNSFFHEHCESLSYYNMRNSYVIGDQSIINAYRNHRNAFSISFKRVRGDVFEIYVKKVSQHVNVEDRVNIVVPLTAYECENPIVPVVPQLSSTLTENQKKMVHAIMNAKPIIDVMKRVQVDIMGVTMVYRIFKKTHHRVEKVLKNKCMIISSDVGSGKTLGVLYAALHTGGIIIVPDDLIDHWRSEISKHFTGLSSSDIYCAHFSKDMVAFTPRVLVASFNFFRRMDISNIVYKSVYIDEAEKCTESVSCQIAQLRKNIDTIIPVTATPENISMNIISSCDTLMSLNIGINSTHLRKDHTFYIPMERKFNIVRDTCYTYQTEVELKLWSEISSLFQSQLTTQSMSTSKLSRVFNMMTHFSSGCKVDPSVAAALIRELLERPSYRYNRGGGDNNVISEIIAKKKSNQVREDGCSICMTGYANRGSGVQYACTHTVCDACHRGIVNTSNRCPFCRGTIANPHRPRWSEEEYEEKEEEQPRKRQKTSGVIDLTGNVELKENLPSKLVSFRLEINKWKSTRKEGDRLVLFMKEKEPVEFFMSEMDKIGMTYVTAGLGTTITKSKKNIEKFKLGGTDVLIASTKFSSGHDLYVANHVWIFNMDKNTSTIVQCEGRVKRLSQKSDTVYIKTFLQKGAFDEFIYKYGSTKNLRRDLIALHFFFTGRMNIIMAYNAMHEKYPKSFKFGTCGDGYGNSGNSVGYSLHIDSKYYDEFIRLVQEYE